MERRAKETVGRVIYREKKGMRWGEAEMMTVGQREST